jgi:serine/threonine protein kinase
MSQEIPNDSILDSRYKIVKTLGRGGFGRAYLAQDSRRYDEQCVLKEFAPEIEAQYWNKAKELFDRECSQLYQLQHDQIPAFRELLKTKFKNKLYVFLVQNYVRGLNYHTIVQKYGTLNEGQILYFLREILPVLTYIHDRNLIHRDISPDNIICRFTDQKPVLIDFGLVKDVSSKYTQMAFTPAGKPWFSPHEQLGGHSISPSSDLYALGVTVLWLLTGKDSKDLYTARSGVWEFQQHANISDGLSKVLAKMLEHRPIDRYKSAAEVSQAIAILPHVNPVQIAINPLDLEEIVLPKQQLSITTSMLALFHRADRWSVLRSDFANPIKYIGGGLVGLFVAIVGISFVLKSCDRSTTTPVVTNSTSSSPCDKIDDRLKAAKVSYDVVNNRFYGKYPDRPRKKLNPKDPIDRQLSIEWCQIAETSIAQQR